MWEVGCRKEWLDFNNSFQSFEVRKACFVVKEMSVFINVKVDALKSEVTQSPTQKQNTHSLMHTLSLSDKNTSALLKVLDNSSLHSCW